MKITNTILFVLISVMVFSQDFKPFITTPNSEYCSGIISFDNDHMVAVHSLNPTDSGGYLRPSDVGYVPFTNIVLYNEKGEETKSLPLIDTDSTIFLTQHLAKLQDGRGIVAGGEYNHNTNTYNLYYGIFSPALDSFDIFKVITTYYTSHADAFVEYYNGDLIFFSGNHILQYSIDGVLKRFQNIINPNNCSDFYSYTMHHFNKDLYFKCASPKYLIVDSSFNQVYREIPDFLELTNSEIPSFALKGKKLVDSKYLFLVNALDTPIIASQYIYHPTILYIDEQKNLNTFFVDSNTSVAANNPSMGHNIEFKDIDHIYAIFQLNVNSKREFVLYSLNSAGNVNWKKYITLPNELEEATSGILGSFFNACLATNDKGFLFTYTVEGIFNSSDVYYYKVDSLGNPTDYPTGIFSENQKISFNDFLIYPNSIKDILDIETGLTGIYKMKIYNLLGQEIIHTNITNKDKVQLENLKKGNYFYSIFNFENELLQTGKLLKE